MDCRTFHKNLEDYLEDGLDFAGRFGMERHADQCISCGKDLAAAHKIRSMVCEVGRVRAPENFEASLLDKIGRQKAQRRFSGLRRFWIYRLRWPSPARLVLASSGLAVMGIVLFIFSGSILNDRAADVAPIVTQAPARPVKVQEQPVAVYQKNDLNTLINYAPEPREALPVSVVKSEVAESRKIPAMPETVPVSALVEPEEAVNRRTVEPEITETDYVEYQVIGPDNRPVTFRVPLPVKTRINSGQTHEEYFIRNVSH